MSLKIEFPPDQLCAYRVTLFDTVKAGSKTLFRGYLIESDTDLLFRKKIDKIFFSADGDGFAYLIDDVLFSYRKEN